MRSQQKVEIQYAGKLLVFRVVRGFAFTYHEGDNGSRNKRKSDDNLNRGGEGYKAFILALLARGLAHGP